MVLKRQSTLFRSYYKIIADYERAVLWNSLCILRSVGNLVFRFSAYISRCTLISIALCAENELQVICEKQEIAVLIRTLAQPAPFPLESRESQDRPRDCASTNVAKETPLPLTPRFGALDPHRSEAKRFWTHFRRPRSIVLHNFRN